MHRGKGVDRRRVEGRYYEIAPLARANQTGLTLEGAH